jgi:hypothetical protein
MSRPLNFLHLTTFYPPYSFGGDAMYIYRLLLRFPAQNCEQEIRLRTVGD